MSDPKDELPPPVVPESERLGLEDTLIRFVSGLNYNRVSTLPKLADHFILRMELDGNLYIRYRLPEPRDEDMQVEERAVYLIERRTKGRGKKARQWWVVTRLSDGEELADMKPYKPVEDSW